MKTVARSEETVVVVPPVLDVVQVQVALVIVLVQDRTVEVTVRVPPDQTDNVLSAIRYTIHRILDWTESDLRSLTHQQKAPSVFIIGQAA